jgi:hypothetical protein
MLVIGPSGGGGGSGSVDPTSVASTGDIKFRPTSELVSGWIKLNGTTIGNATSGATQRANADVQNLFVYLWTNCPNTHCAVSCGRGASGLADFNANKQMTVLDMRGRSFFGLDDMGNSPAGRILASNVTSGGGDTTTTPNATGGEANHVLQVSELASHTHGATVVDPGHTHGYSDPGHVHGLHEAAPTTLWSNGFNGLPNPSSFSPGNPNSVGTTDNANTGITISSAGTGVSLQDGLGHINVTQPAGSGAAHNTMPPMMLGTWLQKL